MTLPQPTEIKQRILNILKDNNLSQDEFLKKNNLNAMTFQRMNKFYPLLNNLMIMANALDVSVDYLLYGNETGEDVFIHMINYQKLNDREKKVVDAVIKTLLDKE